MLIEDETLRSAREKAVSEAIRELWRPDAEAVIHFIESGNECVVVAAPGGSGKSVNLLPMLEMASRERGFSAVAYNCQRLPSRSDPEMITRCLDSRVNKPLEKEKVILILDEPSIGSEAMRAVLKWVDDQQFSGVISLFRVQPGQEGDILTVGKWIEAANGQGKKCMVYEMKQKLLPLDLAKAFLGDIKHKRSDLVDYITNNFPLYPRVLDRLGSANDVKEVLEYWRDMVWRTNREGFSFTEEEANIVNRRLGIGL